MSPWGAKANKSATVSKPITLSVESLNQTLSVRAILLEVALKIALSVPV